jgi:hypothetical protein
LHATAVDLAAWLVIAWPFVEIEGSLSIEDFDFDGQLERFAVGGEFTDGEASGYVALETINFDDDWWGYSTIAEWP